MMLLAHWGCGLTRVEESSLEVMVSNLDCGPEPLL